MAINMNRRLQPALLLLVVVFCGIPSKAFQNLVGNKATQFSKSSTLILHRRTTTALYDKNTKKQATEVLLQKALGVDQQTVQTIIQKYPAILGYEPESLLERIEWHKDYLDLDGKQLAHSLKTTTIRLFKSVETLEANIAAYQTILGLDAQQVKLLARKRPLILSYSVPLLRDNVESIAEIFEFDLETEREKMWKCFLRNPSVLTYTTEGIRETVDWFRNRLGVVKNTWMQAHLLHSQRLLAQNINSLVKKSLWLKDRLELDEEQLARIIRYYPNFLSLSIDHLLEPLIQWMEQSFGLRDESVVGTMVSKHPAILGYSIERNLEPKLAFFVNRVFGGDEAKALKVLAHTPRYLGCSLEKRLLPRWEQCQELETPNFPPLSSMCVYTNDRWEALLERRRKLPMRDLIW